MTNWFKAMQLSIALKGKASLEVLRGLIADPEANLSVTFLKMEVFDITTDDTGDPEKVSLKSPVEIALTTYPEALALMQELRPGDTLAGLNAILVECQLYVEEGGYELAAAEAVYKKMAHVIQAGGRFTRGSVEAFFLCWHDMQPGALDLLLMEGEFVRRLTAEDGWFLGVLKFPLTEDGARDNLDELENARLTAQETVICQLIDLGVPFGSMQYYGEYALTWCAKCDLRQVAEALLAGNHFPQDAEQQQDLLQKACQHPTVVADMISVHPVFAALVAEA